jgi:hypothetical protein
MELRAPGAEIGGCVPAPCGCKTLEQKLGGAAGRYPRVAGAASECHPTFAKLDAARGPTNPSVPKTHLHSSPL